jgi:hypothetical protein
MRLAITLWLCWPLTAAIAPALASADDADPFVWTAPAALPDPPATVDLAELERSGMPAAGLEVIKTVPGSQAKTLGIMNGDIIVALGDRHPRFHQDFNDSRTTNGPDTLEIWNPGQGTHSVVVQSGKIGVTMKAVWHPEAGFLRSTQRSAAWDREVVAAALSFRSDPELALAALAQAKAHGYDGIYLRTLQACASFHAGRFGEALALGEASTRTLPTAERAESIYAMYASALRDFKLPEAQSILARTPDWHIDSDGFAAYGAAHEAILARHGGFPHPLAIDPQGPRYDLASVIHCFNHDGNDVTGDFAKVLRGTSPMTWDCPTDLSMGFEIAFPKVQWLELTMVFRVSYKSQLDVDGFAGIILDPPGGHRVLHAGFYDSDSYDYTEKLVAPGESMVVVQGLPGAIMDLPYAKLHPRELQLHMAVRDGIVESTLDGRPHSFVPLLAGDAPLSLYFLVYGSRFMLKSLSVVSHDPQPPPDWTAPGQPAVQPKATKADDF